MWRGGGGALHCRRQHHRRRRRCRRHRRCRRRHNRPRRGNKLPNYRCRRRECPGPPPGGPPHAAAASRPAQCRFARRAVAIPPTRPRSVCWCTRHGRGRHACSRQWRRGRHSPPFVERSPPLPRRWGAPRRRVSFSASQVRRVAGAAVRAAVGRQRGRYVRVLWTCAAANVWHVDATGTRPGDVPPPSVARDCAMRAAVAPRRVAPVADAAPARRPRLYPRATLRCRCGAWESSPLCGREGPKRRRRAWTWAFTSRWCCCTWC